MTAIGWDVALAFRMRRQHLLRAEPAGAVTAARTLFGLHAQLTRSALRAAAVRGAEPGEVARAVQAGALVKTWTLRGTLHLVAPEDLATFVAAMTQLKPRHHQPAWCRYHGIEREQVDAALAAIPDALAHAPLTREQLAAAVAELTGDAGVAHALRDGWGAMLKLAAFRGDLRFAGLDGGTVRFAQPDPPASPPDPAAATAAIVRRYLAAYGPATREEFARWFGTPSAAQAGRWIAALGDEVAGVEVGGTRRAILAADLDALLAAAPDGTVRALPAFDPYVVAAPRDVPEVVGDRERVYRKQGWLSPVVVADGRVAGTWDEDGAIAWFGAPADAAQVARDLAAFAAAG